MASIVEQIVRITTDGEETRAEVVGELIRCEKCKKWRENFGGGNYGYCYRDLGLPHTTDASDYCSRWEKKEWSEDANS